MGFLGDGINDEPALKTADVGISVDTAVDIANIARFILFIGPISSVFDYAMYFLMLWGFNAWTNPSLFQTGWFVESLLSQTLIVHVIRTGRIPFLQSWPSLPLLLTTLLICGIGAFLPYPHFAHARGLVPLPLEYWFALAGILVLYLRLTQLVKGRLTRRFGLG